MSENNKALPRQVAAYYWRHAKSHPLILSGLSIILPLTILCNQFLPALIVANVLRRLTKQQFLLNNPWHSFGHDIVVYAAVLLLGVMVLWRLVDILVWRLEGLIQREIAREVFDHLAHESADFHANHFSGSLVSQTNKLISSYIRIADSTFFSTIPLASSLVFASVILAPKAPLFVGLLLLFSAFFIVTALIVSKPVRKAGRSHSTAESAQTGYLADVIGNIMAVKSFAGEGYENMRFGEKTEYTFRKLLGVMVAHQKQMLYFSAVSRVISVTAFAVAIISIVSFHADIATAFLILSYTSNIVEQLFQFSNNSLRNYNRSVGDASDMVRILRHAPEIQDPVHPEVKKMYRGQIDFKNVLFRHKGADEAIFDGLSLRIKPGEKVGLIGHSGSGKTTLTRLLLRFSDIESGNILIDGQDITSVTQQDLRRAIAYVPQEPILFHRTIAENISYGRQDSDSRMIEAISKQANADEFISGLQHGYETVVGERGVKLSGGQRQRIAIARAMLKNAPILLLDEATSALDSESEALIQDALWKLMEGRSAIVIAHRLSTIQKMDRIIVLDDGRIVEEGSHKDLLYQKGVYASLWNRQSGGFLDD